MYTTGSTLLSGSAQAAGMPAFRLETVPPAAFKPKSEVAVMRHALLWAAGNPLAEFHLRPEQYDTFFEAAKLHRISGRLLRRLRDEVVTIPEEFHAGALRLHDFTTDYARIHMHTADALGSALRQAGSDEYLILLKGFTLFAYTGDPLDLRLSGDLDVCVSDLMGFVGIAKEHGFRHMRPLDHLAEFAVMAASGKDVIELHSRFDITAPDPDLNRNDIDPASHPGVWEQRKHFRVRYLRHCDLSKHLGESSVIPDTAKPLRPEMAALVSAAHMYKNFLRYPYPLPFATIPLDEVATFRDLCRLPAFDAARFDALVQQFDANAAVSFAFRLAADLLGGGYARSSDSPLLPGSLWWDGLDGGGFPVELKWDPLQLVYRDQPISSTIEALGPLHVSGISSPYEYSFRLLGDGGAPTVERAIVRGHRCGFAADCTISVHPAELRFGIRMPRLERHRMAAVAVCLQDYRYEMFLNTSARDYFVDYSARCDASQEVAASLYTSPEGDGIELKLPAKVLDHCARDGAIHGLLVVREQFREWGQITAGAAVPLRIQVPA